MKHLKYLIPLGFLAIAFYAIANNLNGWGWAFFLTLITYNIALDRDDQ